MVISVFGVTTGEVGARAPSLVTATAAIPIRRRPSSTIDANAPWRIRRRTFANYCVRWTCKERERHGKDGADASSHDGALHQRKVLDEIRELKNLCPFAPRSAAGRGAGD